MHGARRTVSATTSTTRWASESIERESEFEGENAKLLERGFLQGVYTWLGGRREGRGRREAASWVLVFATAAGAQQELADNVAAARSFPRARAYTVSTIPGATGIGGLRDHGRKGGYANIFFTTGRCVATVGDALHQHAPRRFVAQPATSGATALYKRLAPLCS